MFGLADEVVDDVIYVSGVICQDCDLGRPSFGVNPHNSHYQALSRSHIHVAGSGNDVDGFTQPLAVLFLAACSAVSEHGDCLGPSHGVDLINA